MPSAPAGTQRRYVDATKIPYVVLPQAVVRKYSIQAGAIVMVHRPSTGRSAFAAYGDGGKLGEGSVKLHLDLGSDPIRVKDGVQRAKRRIDDRVVTFVFPVKSTPILDDKAWNAEIQRLGMAALEEFGGMPRVSLCAKLGARRP